QTFNDFRIDPNNFSLRLAVYRNYLESPTNIYQCSAWTSDPNILKAFISPILATGGGEETPEEAIEVGLAHAFYSADNIDLTQIILIGDNGPNSSQDIERLLNRKTTSYQRGCAYKKEHTDSTTSIYYRL